MVADSVKPDIRVARTVDVNVDSPVNVSAVEKGSQKPRVYRETSPQTSCVARENAGFTWVTGELHGSDGGDHLWPNKQ